MVVVLDTHTLMFVSDPSLGKLGAQANELLDAPGQFIVSTVSLYEIGQKFRIGKLEFGENKLRNLPDFITQANMEIIDVDRDIAIEASLLNWRNRDPVDRIIVATALKYDARLVTKDRAIHAYIPDRAVW